MTPDNQRNDTITDGTPFLRRLRARFAALSPGDHSINLKVGGIRVYFRARIVAQPKKLLFTFHGAANRDARKVAIPFNSFVPNLDDTHQISISDPTLMESGDLRVGWYAGNANFDAQFHLRGAFRTIAKALNIERTIYFGSSAGGYAALYYSYFAPRSIALVFNPQTSITAYHATAVNHYRAACWPELTDNEQLSDEVCSDVTKLYAQGFRNTVIYCQSMGDWHHLEHHMAPFVGAIAASKQYRRFLLYSDFKGVEGHVSDYEAFHDWIQTIARSQGENVKEILNLWHAIRHRPKLDPLTAPSDTGKAQSDDASMTETAVTHTAAKPGFRPDDIATIMRLRAFREINR